MATSSLDMRILRCDCSKEHDTHGTVAGVVYHCQCEAGYRRESDYWRHVNGPQAGALVTRVGPGTGRASVWTSAPLEADLASARSEIERLKEFTARQEGRCIQHRADIERLTRETDQLAKDRAHEERMRRAEEKVGDEWYRRYKDLTKAYEGASTGLLNRAFTFLTSLSPQMNAPALSAQGKAERLAYEALCKDLKAALRPSKEGK